MSGNLSCRLISTANLRNQRHSSTIAHRASMAKTDWAKKSIIGPRKHGTSMHKLTTVYIRYVRSSVHGRKSQEPLVRNNLERLFYLSRSLSTRKNKELSQTRSGYENVMMLHQPMTRNLCAQTKVAALPPRNPMLEKRRLSVTAVNKNTFRMQRSMNHSTLIDWLIPMDVWGQFHVLFLANSYTCLAGMSHQLWITPRAPQRKHIDILQGNTRQHTHTHISHTNYYNTTQCIVLRPKNTNFVEPFGGHFPKCNYKMPPPNPTALMGGDLTMQHNVPQHYTVPQQCQRGQRLNILTFPLDGTVRWSCEKPFLGKVWGQRLKIAYPNLQQKASWFEKWGASADGDSIDEEDYPLEGRRPMKSDGFASKIAAMTKSGINSIPTIRHGLLITIILLVHAHVSLIAFPRSWSLWSIQIDVWKVNKHVEQFWKGTACCHCIINAPSDDIESSYRYLTNNKPRVRRKMIICDDHWRSVCHKFWSSKCAKRMARVETKLCW